MSAFVNSLRTRGTTIALPSAGADAITVRVELPETWDVVRVSASPSTPLSAVKAAALGAMAPDASFVEDFVAKFRGWEVLDEGMSLADAGLTDGSILLVTHRRRRAVR